MNKHTEICEKDVSGLIHSSDEAVGFRRKKHGRGFIYYDSEGEKITEKKTLDRIKNIGIPPVWEQVWICPNPLGHLQATGLDTKGRKQYLYHEEWSAFQQESKFDRLVEFGYALPRIRESVEKDLKQKQWTKKKVVALIIGILDETYIRIGNKQYLELNETHGLTTLRRKHLEINDRHVIFEYRAKSGKMRVVKLKNKKFVKLVKECSELPGYEVFRYKNEKGKMVPVTSVDVNEYLKEVSGEQFSSKNFRTWGGTVLAIKRFPLAKEKVKANKRLKLRRAIVKEVANELNNTIAISEKYYIHPDVLDVLDNENFSAKRYKLDDKPKSLDFEEKVALVIITSDPSGI